MVERIRRTVAPASFASPTPRQGSVAVRALIVFAIMGSLAAATGFVVMSGQSDRNPARASNKNPDPTPITGATPAPAVGGVPLFSTWPKDQPELVLVLTGQTHGYLSPCGCSRPQRGGLERRANFMDKLRGRGWTVVGLDLGDAAPNKGLARQNQLKYRYTMKALGEMGYAAIGLGDHEFSQQLLNLLAEFTLQNPNKPPIVLAGNLLGVAERSPDGKPTKWYTREEYFAGGPNTRPMVEMMEVIAPTGKPAVGVVGVIGKDVAQKAEKLDSQFAFAANDAVIAAANEALDKHPAKPALKVLLYAGNLDLAKEAAKRFPHFQLIVCDSEESEPPQFPTMVNNGKTMIVQLGHKGQNVGVVGLYKNDAGGIELKYQLVPLGEEYLTPEDPQAEKNHRVLQLLEEYTSEVKKQNLLAAARAKPLQHAAQIQHPAAKLTYVGAEACAKCHAGEYAVWKGTKHPLAYQALEKDAKRPSLRQYDPDCVICHTTGFEFIGGFENETHSAFLKGNQCENCHGPGSAHTAKPNDKTFYPALKAWQLDPKAKLPDLDTLKKIAAMKPLERNAAGLKPDQIQLINSISSMCMKCHDGENDPKFDFYDYFPKIYHSGLKNAGLPPGAK